jgi:site-specific recombinase XerD
MREKRDTGLVFGSNAETRFQPSNVWRRAHTAWKQAGLKPIGLHEARHSFASLQNHGHDRSLRGGCDRLGPGSLNGPAKNTSVR